MEMMALQASCFGLICILASFWFICRIIEGLGSHSTYTTAYFPENDVDEQEEEGYYRSMGALELDQERQERERDGVDVL